MKKFWIAMTVCVIALCMVAFVACDDKNQQPKDSFVVSFDGASIEAQTVEEGKTATVPQEPTRVGWNFDGWFVGEQLFDFATPIVGNITLTAKYSSALGGSGVEGDPFTVDSAQEYDLMRDFVAQSEEFATAYYLQTADITIDTNPIGQFRGKYDGGMHTINTTAPIFWNLTNAEVCNLKIVADIEGLGALASRSANSSISHVQVDGNVSAHIENTISATSFVGGLIGQMDGGSMLNCSSSASVSGENAGGLVGALDLVQGEYALLQNVSSSASVSAVQNAGGVVAQKNANSVIYRAFVHGASIEGVNVGAVVGENEFGNSFGSSNIIECSVRSDVSLNGKEYKSAGEKLVDDFADMILPAHIWDMSGEVPILKDEVETPQNRVKVVLDGADVYFDYGKHIDVDCYTLDGLYFSRAILLDAQVELKTVDSIFYTYEHARFNAGYTEIEFLQDGIILKEGGTERTINIVATFAFSTSFVYTPDFSTPEYSYDVIYDAPVSVLNIDGEQIAFVIEKQQIQSGYVAFLESYKLVYGEWQHDRSWYPISNDVLVGAYQYQTAFAMFTNMTHFVIIDDTYKVVDGIGYYPTLYKPLYVTGDDVEEGEYVAGRGQTVMFLGLDETNDFMVALAFDVNLEGYVDFIFFDDSHNLVSSTNAPVSNATQEFLVGNWFDGVSKYQFDLQTSTVTKLTNGSSQSTTFAIDGQYITFAFDDEMRVALVPTGNGAYKLVSKNDKVFEATIYGDGLFDGEWISQSGDIISITDGLSVALTVNGNSVDAINTIYNGAQAIKFVINGEEHYIISHVDANKIQHIHDTIAESMYDLSMIKSAFVGNYVSVADGVRYELAIDKTLHATLHDAQNSILNASALPIEIDGKTCLVIASNGNQYIFDREKDVVSVAWQDRTLVFCDANVFARFVGEFTNGVETLTINANGSFVRYNRVTSTFTPAQNLTATYRAERALYGGENRGFVLGYTVDDDEYFFYVDVDALNVRFFKSWIATNGDSITRMQNNFVEEAELASIFGSYERTFEGSPDVLTFLPTGVLTRSYTELGVHKDVEVSWYPILNYNYNTKIATLGAYTFEDQEDGMGFTTYVEFTLMGLKWGTNAYMSSTLSAVFTPYTQPVFVNADNTMLTVSITGIKFTYLKEQNGTYRNTTASFAFDAFTIDGNTITFELVETGLGINNPRKAVATFETLTDAMRITFAIAGGNDEVYVSQQPIDYNAMIGEYVFSGVTYKFVVEESWYGTTITLSYKDGNAQRQFNYSQSNGVVILSNGKQALPLSHYIYGERFVYKDGDSLVICSSLDASTNCIFAEDIVVAAMPTYAQLKEKLNGVEFKNGNDVVSFKVDNQQNLVLVDGANEYKITSNSKHKGQYHLIATDKAVVVYINQDSIITKIVVGDSIESVQKEYTPNVSYPTVAQLKEMLLEVGFKSQSGKTARFFIFHSWMGDYYQMAYDGNEYDYEGGSLKDGVYTFEMSWYFGDNIFVEIFYSVGGIEKVVIDGENFLPVTLPTAIELKAILSGKTFVAENDSTKTMTFMQEDGLFGKQWYVMFDNAYDDREYCDEEGTKVGNVYHYAFGYSWAIAYNIQVTLNTAGEVEKVTYSGTDYILQA